jgi:hypothetical protein
LEKEGNHSNSKGEGNKGKEKTVVVVFAKREISFTDKKIIQDKSLHVKKNIEVFFSKSSQKTDKIVN